MFPFKIIFSMFFINLYKKKIKPKMAKEERRSQSMVV